MNVLPLKENNNKQNQDELNDPTAANQTIHNYFVQQNFTQCMELIDKQVAKFSDACEYPLYVKGLILRQQGRIQESLSTFQKVVDLNPGNIDNIKQVGKTYMLLGRFKDAIDNFAEALSKTEDPDWECLHNKAMCLQQLGNDEQAIDCFLQAIEAEPQQVTLCALGKAYANMGKYEDALQQYKNALELSPENVDLLTTVGIMYLRMGNSDKAFESFGAALSIDARNPQVYFFFFSFFF